MKYKQLIWPDLSVETDVSMYISAEGIAEYHAMIRLTDTSPVAEEQYKRIEEALKLLTDKLESKLVWKRYFVSDAANQQIFMQQSAGEEAFSIVQQPPLNGTKAVVWAYLLPEVKLLKDDQGISVMEHGGYRHLYHTQLHSQAPDESSQTATVFRQYIKQLAACRCTLADHCIRTWIYVQGIDMHYKGMVAARKACFDAEGLTSRTHFIASTGIEGKYTDPSVLVLMDAYAVQDMQPEQVQYLHAPAHLNPTHEYGVTFERGTVIHYGDRRHIFISGTASINNRGTIEHRLDIGKQTIRMFENIRALLAEAEAGMEDVAHLIVYLRDIADYGAVHIYLEENYAEIPKVILWAPVCRPGWLIEAECMAIKMAENKAFRPY
jgi:enamine deaminase RidA (YjgF/YER057c/UK114 family)